MKEIEVKILEIDVEEVRKKLLELGAEKVFEGDMKSYAMDTEDKLITKKGELLRVRIEGSEVKLNYKSKHEDDDEDHKVFEETEVPVGDFDKTVKLLGNLGFAPIVDYSKHRESYKLGDVRFEIDVYPDIPAFLEIEAPTKEDIKKAVEMLGYNMENTCKLTGKDIFEKYGKEE